MVAIPLGIPEDIDNYFYNRERELIQLKSLIDNLKYNVSNQILLTGFRGVGKTFLLKKFIKTLPKNILSCYIDISKIYGMQKAKLTEEEVLYCLLEEMNESVKNHGKGLKKINHSITTLLKKINSQDYDFKDAGTLLSIPIPQVNDNYKKLSKFVLEFPQKVVKASNGEIKGFVIIIDEFQFISKLKSPESFFWLIRSFTQEQDNVSYIFTGSTSTTSEMVEELNGISGAYGQRMIQLTISPFSEKETNNYLKDKISEIKFSKDGLKRFYKCTRGYPAYINSFCNIMNNDKVYNEKMIINEFYNKLDQIAIKWIILWSSLSKEEKEIITTINESESLKLKDLNEKIDFSKGTLIKYLKKLKNKGIVSHIKTDYMIEDYMLSAWLKHRKKEDSYYPL
ncbi:MAG: ATP-binding protein [Methanobrevibacter sp.]|nr:ATP-binding protein [Methanobrevibacter sp.]